MTTLSWLLNRQYSVCSVVRSNCESGAKFSRLIRVTKDSVNKTAPRISQAVTFETIFSRNPSSSVLFILPTNLASLSQLDRAIEYAEYFQFLIMATLYYMLFLFFFFFSQITRMSERQKFKGNYEV